VYVVLVRRFNKLRVYFRTERICVCNFVNLDHTRRLKPVPDRTGRTYDLSRGKQLVGLPVSNFTLKN